MKSGPSLVIYSAVYQFIAGEYDQRVAGVAVQCFATIDKARILDHQAVGSGIGTSGKGYASNVMANDGMAQKDSIIWAVKILH